MCAGFIGINLGCADFYDLPPNYYFNAPAAPRGLNNACSGEACPTKNYILNFLSNGR